MAAAAAVASSAPGQGVESRFPAASGELETRETAPVSLGVPPRLLDVDPPPGCLGSGSGLGEVVLTFDAPVSVAAGAIRLFDSAGASFSPSTIAISPSGEVVTVGVDPALRERIVRVVIGPGVVAGGEPLDGEIAAPDAPVFPSGNGFAGGEAVLLYRALPGDANCDGVVDLNDAQMIVGSLGLAEGDTGYAGGADFNGDGFVNVLDVAVWSQNSGAELPPTDGVAPTASLVVSDAFEQVVVEFSEPMRFAALSEASLALIDDDGALVGVESAAALDGDTAAFTLSEPLSPGASYTVTLSNALADLSGELLDAGSTSFALTPEAASSTFPPRSFPVGFGPSLAAAGDVDGDGVTDYVVTNSVDGTISILLGRPDGTFEDQIMVNVGNSPRGVALADFDGDGFLDVAVTLVGDDAVAVLFGDGSGDFGASARGMTILPVGDAPVFVATAQLNADDRPDLAVVNRDDATVSIRLSQPDRTFLSRPDVVVGGVPQAAALGDLIGGSPVDLAVVDEANDEARIYPGLGDGLFGASARGGVASFPTGAGPVYVGIGDLFDDKDLDLVVANKGGGSVTVISPGDAPVRGFTQNIPAGEGTVYVGIGDLFDDKDLDLITADSEDDQLTPIEQNPPGVLSPIAPIPTGDQPVYTRIADVNGDGVNDVVALVARDGVTRRGALTVLLGDPVDGVQGQRRISTLPEPIELAIGAVNDDDAPDLVVTGGDSKFDGFEVLLGDGAGDFSSDGTIFTNGLIVDLSVGDVLGDDASEILGASLEPRQVAVFEDDPKGGFLSDVAFPDGTLSLVADVLPELAGDEAIVAVTGGIEIYNLNLTGRGGKGPSPAATLSVDGGFISAMTVGDFDGDGALDIVATGFQGAFDQAFKRGDVSIDMGGVIVFRASAARGGETFPIENRLDLGALPADLVPVQIAVANVQPASGAEVVVAGNRTVTFRGAIGNEGLVVIFERDDKGEVVSDQQLFVAEALGGLAVADFTGDGLADIAASSPVEDEALVFKASPAGGFADPERYETHVGPTRIRAADLNGDGAIDLAVLNRVSADVTLLFGTTSKSPDAKGTR